jgi:hypothetical protein
MPWMETGAGHVELLIGLDNRQWLPTHVEVSWNPDDNMRLMKSVFGYRYMITDGWGRDLFPPDNPRGGPADAQGGSVEATEGAQDVRLEEYRGWSQGAWSPENSGVQGAVIPRGGCQGARPRSRGGTAARGVPVTRREASQGGGSRGSRGTHWGPPAPPALFGMPHSQGKWEMLLRPKKEIPPPKKRAPANPSPAPSRGGWNRGGPNPGQRGRGRTVRIKQSRRQLLPDPGGIPGPLQPAGPVDPVERLALMMAVMMLGMPPVHGYHASMEPRAWGDGGSMELRIHPPILTGESRGALVTGEQSNSRTRHGTSPMERDGSAALRGLRQTRLEMEKVGKMNEEKIQERRLEMQRTLRLETEKVGRMREEIQEEKREMQKAHQMEMEEMRRTFSLEMEEMKRALQSNEKGTQKTNRPRADTQRHLGEVWKPGDDGPILARVGGANLPIDGGGTASVN